MNDISLWAFVALGGPESYKESTTGDGCLLCCYVNCEAKFLKNEGKPAVFCVIPNSPLIDRYVPVASVQKN